jgi:hypothetical protein
VWIRCLRTTSASRDREAEVVKAKALSVELFRLKLSD